MESVTSERVISAVVNIVAVDQQLELCVDTRREISSSSAAGPSGTTASVDRAAAATAGSPPAGTGTGETPGHTGQLSDTQRHTHCPAPASTRTVTQPDGGRGDSSRLHPADDQRALRRHRINQRTTTSLGPQGRSAQLSVIITDCWSLCTYNDARYCFYIVCSLSPQLGVIPLEFPDDI